MRWSKYLVAKIWDSSALAPRAFAAALLLAAVACIAAGVLIDRAVSAAEKPPATPTVTSSTGATPGAEVQGIPNAASSSAPGSSASNERADVLNFLGETVGWYRQLAIEERFATQPAEMLFVDDDHRTALDSARLAFEYARAMVTLLKSEKRQQMPQSPNASAPGAWSGNAADRVPGLNAMVGRAQEQQRNLEKLKQQAEQLKAASASAKPAQRANLARQLSVIQSQIELTQSRVDSYSALIQFETTTLLVGGQSSGMSGQIEALERSLPELNATAKGTETASRVSQPAPAATATAKVDDNASASDKGLLGTIEALITLAKERGALDDRISETRRLSAANAESRKPLIARLRELNARADALAAQPASDDVGANRARKQQFDALTARHKMITDALVPLAKQGVLFQVYVTNLQQWRGSVDQRSDNKLRGLVIRLAALGAILFAIFIGAFVWRTLTFRYVGDLRRRRQLLQLRRLTLAVVVALVVIFDFSSQLGTLATVMGLAAAGVALALQNVILSFAGYFFVTGRYGIRVGDRIQIAGTSGDVIDIGLFKLALMELGGEGGSRQPTGRVVVFPNSIVFQTNGNFFKQAPGTNFVWNDFRLTLSPECDYRLAEKRLLEVVEDVYARYRDTMQRQYSNLERDLSMKLESPKPQSRLRLGPNGIELTIRYPADVRHAVQVADEISRRALDAIAQDPTLSLAFPGTPNLMPMAPPLPRTVAPSAPPQASAGRDTATGESERAAGGEAMLPASAEVMAQEPTPQEPTAPGPPASDKS